MHFYVEQSSQNYYPLPPPNKVFCSTFLVDYSAKEKVNGGRGHNPRAAAENVVPVNARPAATTSLLRLQNWKAVLRRQN